MLGRSSDVFSQETTRLQIDQFSLKQSRNETNCCQCLSFSFTPQPSLHQPVKPLSFIGRCTAMSLDANELGIRHFSHLNQRLRASSCLLYSCARVHPKFQLRSRIEYCSNMSPRRGALTQVYWCFIPRTIQYCRHVSCWHLQPLFVLHAQPSQFYSWLVGFFLQQRMDVSSHCMPAPSAQQSICRHLWLAAGLGEAASARVCQSPTWIPSTRRCMASC